MVCTVVHLEPETHFSSGARVRIKEWDGGGVLSLLELDQNNFGVGDTLVKLKPGLNCIRSETPFSTGAKYG